MRALFILSLASTALSARHSPAKPRRIENRGLQDLNLDAAAIFPPHSMEKRGLLGSLLNTVGSVVGDVVTPLVTALVPATSAAATTAPTTSSSSDAPGQTTANNPTSNTPSPGASPTSSANSPANTGSSSSGNLSAGGPGNASKDGNGVVGTNVYIVTGSVTTRAQVVTDHFGNPVTITGAYTMTYVTTLPNGVVSTVTEVITPTFEVTDSSPHTSMEPGKIAAIVGTIVVVFLVIFTVAFAFLMMRKRQKRRIELTRSRPTSASSFGSVGDEFNHIDERRNSHAALAPSASTTSFTTARAYVDGTQMEFPLPPLPVATTSRPLSGDSDNSFEFSQYRKSRASIIEERNLFRKIGQYPDADSYTPFVLPPSEFGHSTEASHTPRTSATADQERGVEKSFHEAYRKNQNPDLLTGGGSENPFIDPVAVPQTSYSPPVVTTSLLANNVARKSTLWRSATFGSNVKNARAMTQTEPASPSRSTAASLVPSTEYGTAESHRYTYSAESNNVVSRHLSTSTHYSYHSAFDAYVAEEGSAPSTPLPAENPFADQAPPSTPQVPSPTRVVYPSLRPMTASSGSGSARPNTGTSVVSSIGNGSRELGATPDPEDLFYRNSGERNFAVSRTRISEESQGGTIRGSSVAYPGLWNVATRSNGQSKLSQSRQ